MIVAAGSETLKSVAAYVVWGGLIGVGMTFTIIRFARSRKPREEQMARLAVRLNGERQVYLRMEENGLDHADLVRVAGSRGYGLIVHRFGKYYEFVYAPHRFTPTFRRPT
ncbi:MULTISPECIES: hypothetical protein [unclassified Amycolatopsis]|uniref:hypothetical protein n=1 Tax=unclassified Amycolatopsis TaxID=2618356 RepID=UPI002E1E7CB9|nr:MULTISPECIES: hypothetical protein [unclassified Amycolatopsis]